MNTIKILKYIFLLFLMASIPFTFIQSQSLLTGKVISYHEGNDETHDQPDEPIVGANVFWKGTTDGTTTDVDGNFSIQKPNDSETLYLMVSFVGYNTVEVEVLPSETKLIIQMQLGVTLESVDITAKNQKTFISTIDPMKTETITADELCKAACCNLAESFETNASVDVESSDAVSGAKEVRMLGLDGIYVQLLTEGLPSLRGLATTYGLNYIPGPWIGAIQVNKGSGSVTNGYESITGQINVDYHKPEKAEMLYLNLFGNDRGRIEGNLNLAHRLNDKWSTMTLLHASDFSNKIDHNKDGFIDMPLLRTLNGIHRWKYKTDKLIWNIGVKGLKEDRNGGQISFDKNKERTTDNGYGIGIFTKRFEVFNKMGVIFNQHQSIGIMLNGTVHNQDAYFGLKDYAGQQNSLYANLIFQTEVINKKHLLKVGSSFVYDDYDEQFNQTDYQRTDYVPGIFTEYTFKQENKFTLVGGIRGDYHNHYGFYLSPRLHLKYNITDHTTLRASTGKGFRVANIFADNINIFASARILKIEEDLRPEEAWNYGANLTQNFKWMDREGYASIDFYRTDFINQVIVDAYTTENGILFYNLNGKSFSNSLQAEFNYELLKGLDVKLAYKMDDVQATYKGTTIPLPFISTHKGLLNLSYEGKEKRWQADATAQFHGQQRLTAGLEDNQVNVNNNSDLRSPSHVVFNAQISHHFPKPDLEIYLGGENLNNFLQKNPIVGYTSPFTQGFDATNIWGPVLGRRFYLGLRYRIGANKQQ